MDIANQQPAKKTPLLVCKSCDFKCYKQSDYERHLVTIKHKMLIDANKKTPNKEEQAFNCICGNKYNHNSSFSRHKRTCAAVNKHESNSITKEDNSNTINDDVLKSETKFNEKKDSTTEKELKDLVKDLIKQNGELMKTINDIIPKIGNTTNNNTMNNNFNLNVFLNEQCKDALNISDFIDSLKITLEDLLFSKTNGISRGITDVMIKGLKELDIHKRPIHCTDIKRDIMYIKDEDKWQKDENHEMMKNTIVKIADKERTALQKWAIDNPDWMETERKQIAYLTMMRSICEPIENYNNYERKIIKNLGKEILIDKKN
uniref:C2H2-type domain-containing protein n=1 Tax=viral metagenome TaxID=1070528 RepID=A0A6C0EZ40_9ZZZZ